MSSSALLASDQPAFTSLDASAPVVDHGIVSRTLLATPEMRVVLFSFAGDQALTEHTSTARAWVQVLSGECEFTVDGQPKIMRGGDVLHMPPRAPHAVRALGPMTMLLTLAPERKAS